MVKIFLSTHNPTAMPRCHCHAKRPKLCPYCFLGRDEAAMNLELNAELNYISKGIGKDDLHRP